MLVVGIHMVSHILDEVHHNVSLYTDIGETVIKGGVQPIYDILKIYHN